MFPATVGTPVDGDTRPRLMRPLAKDTVYRRPNDEVIRATSPPSHSQGAVLPQTMMNDAHYDMMSCPLCGSISGQVSRRSLEIWAAGASPCCDEDPFLRKLRDFLLTESEFVKFD